MAAAVQCGTAIELLMSRQDIDRLSGLTIETVSRTFTQLVQSGTIARVSRRILFAQPCGAQRLKRLKICFSRRNETTARAGVRIPAVAFRAQYPCPAPDR